jgi:hypothetical protein
MFPLPSVVDLIAFRLPVSSVDGDIQDAVRRSSDACVLESEHDFSFVLARVHMSWKTMFLVVRMVLLGGMEKTWSPS